MSRIRLVLLSGAAVAAFTAFSASAAFGAAKFEWSVNGTPLAAGVTLTILLKPDATNGTIVLKGTAFGVATELETNTFTSASTIKGGKPGGGQGVTKFTNVKVVKPKNCTVTGNEVTTNNVNSTIVEGTTSKTPLILLSPVTGSVFASYTYLGSSCSLINDTVNVTGSVLLEPLSTTSQELQLFTFLPSGIKSTSSTGTVSTNTLELAGSGKTTSASISGNVEALLDVALPFSPL
jgi:hypothetical protein